LRITREQEQASGCKNDMFGFSIGGKKKEIIKDEEIIKQLMCVLCTCDRLCGLVVRVLGYRSGGPGSIPGTTKKKAVGLERGPHSLVSTTEELLDRKVAAPV
jgi:hypothetical protein